MTSSGKHYDNIVQRLSAFENNVKRSSQLGRTNINKDAERLFCYPLELLFGGQFINLNTVEANYPAVDLGSMEKRISVQVTSDNDHDKIQSTLDKFFLHGKDRDFDRLIVLIIGERKHYRSSKDTKQAKFPPFELKGKLDFDPDRDIWGTLELLQKIDGLSPEKMEALSHFLDSQLESTGALRPYLYLPPRSAVGDGFVGREKELADMGQQLAKGNKPIVLSGLGGMGKTELAAKFGRDYQGGRVYFTHFQTSFEGTLRNMFSGVHPQPSQPPKEDEQLSTVVQLLEKCTEQDLLIIDNADAHSGSLADLMKDQMYQKLLGMKLRLMITTRFDWNRVLPVDPLPRENLYQIFRTHGADLTEGQMDDLIQAVNGHTMTIDLMARTLNGKGWRRVTAEDLLRAIRENTLPSAKYRKIATDYNQSQEQAQIYQHLSVVFDVSGIPETHRNVLRCATLLPQDGMDGELFGYSLSENQQEALDELLDHGWLSMENDLLRIHPIIRLVCREELKPSDESCGEFLYAVAKHLNPHKNDPACIRQSAELYSHASDILKDIDGDWALFAGLNYFYSGDLAKALNYYNRIIERAETEVLSLETVLAAYNNAGSAYDKFGKYKEAIDHHLVALAVIEKMYPNDSSKKMAYWNNIGASLSNLGDDENALKYKMDALEALKKEKPGCVEMAICLDNIGSTYGNIGKTDTALHFHLQALEILEKEETIELAITLDNIGGIYDKKKEYPTALKFKLRALRIFKRFYSGKNIDLALAYGNVYYTYAAQGDFVSALNYIEKAIQAVPDGHPKLRNYKALREELLNLIKMKRLGIDFPNPFEHP